MKIYCEGEKGSHDSALLAKVLAGLDVKIQPIGGIRNADIAIEEFEKEHETSNGFLFFRDRDFDVAVPDTPSLTVDKYTCYSYLTTIENYLLHPNVFFEFLKEKKLTAKFKLKSHTEVQATFIKAAKQIAYYQALRHTIAQFRTADTFDTTWLHQGSGNLPKLIELNNRPLCRQKAIAKIAATIEETENWSEQAFDDVLNSFSNQFDADSFYENADFLVWFQGKDLAKSLSRLLPQFPMKSYYQFAKKHFDYHQFDDLVELRRIVEIRNSLFGIRYSLFGIRRNE